MAHFLDKDGLQRFFNGLKNVFALKDHSHTTVNGHTVNADVPSGAKFTDTDTIPSAYSTTTSSVQAKTATCTNFHLNANSTLYFVNTSSNSYAGKITMNVNGTGAKDVWINGAVSSSSNYSLPAGGYLAFYDGTKWLFRTDGKLTGSITGDAATVNGKTVGVNVPSDAEFTDTVYTHPSYTSKSSGLYKVTVDSTGHVSGTAAVAKSDITALGIPAQDTTYSSKTAASGGTDVSLVTTGEKYTWNSKTSNTGTVTSVATGVGLTGGSITTSGTIKAKLRSETALTRDSAAATETANRVYPVAQDKSGYLAVNVPWTDTNTQTITGVKGNSESSYRTGNVNLTAANIGAAAATHSHAASDISSGTLDAARIPSLAASKITSGTFDAARIPSLDASKIGSGTLSRDRLPGSLWVDMGTISSLPVTKSFTGVRTDMVVARMELGTPSAQRSDWTVNTDTANSITVSGTISGSTTCKILLVQAESGTAS